MNRRASLMLSLAGFVGIVYGLIINDAMIVALSGVFLAGSVKLDVLNLRGEKNE